MRKGFLTQIVYNNALWVAGVLVLILSALGNIFYFYTDQTVVHLPFFDGIYGSEIGGFKLDQIFKNSWLGSSTRLLLLLGSAILLQYVSSEFRLIRIRSFFPFFLFCIFSASILPAIPLSGAPLASLFFCWSLFRLFSSCTTNSANRPIFDASVLLAIASLFQCKAVFLLPVFWLIMGVLQVFSFRTFFASLLGVFTVYWMIAGVSFLFENFSFLRGQLTGLFSFDRVDFSTFTPAELAYTSFMVILMISAMFSFLPRQNMDKLRTRNYLNSILLLWFSVLALWFFSNNDMGLLLLLFSLSSLMAAHFFSLIDTIFSRTVFIIYIVLSITVYFMID